MSEQDRPKLKVLIKPLFDEAHQADGLHVVLAIESPELAEGSTAILFPSMVRPIVLKNGIKFLDQNGELPTVYKAPDGGAGPTWAIGRQPLGYLQLEYNVLPSSDKVSVGIYADHGGF
jgi:hypothetical protein